MIDHDNLPNEPTTDSSETEVCNEFDDYTENNEEESVVMELDGLLHFGQLLVDLKQGKRKLTQITATGLTKEEFRKRY